MSWLTQLASLLEYQRSAVDAGQWWRLATASLAHTNAIHLAMNAVALYVLTDLLDVRRRPVYVAIIALVSGMLVMLVEHWVGSHGWARGASGALHALVVVVICERLLGWQRVLGLLALVAKLVGEAVIGSASGDLIGAPVLTQHHVYGAALGVMLVAGRVLWRVSVRRLPGVRSP